MREGESRNTRVTWSAMADDRIVRTILRTPLFSCFRRTDGGACSIHA
jgi:hypothetical protein